MPDPRRTHDVIQSVELRLPAQFFNNSLGTGHQHRRISITARLFHYWNRMSGNAAHRIDHLAHTESPPIADVVDQPGTRIEPLKREDMRIRQVADMHVIADAGAIR